MYAETFAGHVPFKRHKAWPTGKHKIGGLGTASMPKWFRFCFSVTCATASGKEEVISFVGLGCGSHQLLEYLIVRVFFTPAPSWQHLSGKICHRLHRCAGLDDSLFQFEKEPFWLASNLHNNGIQLKMVLACSGHFVLLWAL